MRANMFPHTARYKRSPVPTRHVASTDPCMAGLIRVCARRGLPDHDEDIPGENATGEALMWWHPPTPDTTVFDVSVSKDTVIAAGAHADLLRCLATLREGITVSRLRSGIEDALETRETSLNTRLHTSVGPSFDIAHVRTLLRGDAAIGVACTASRATALLLASPDLWRWTVAATLTYMAAACRLRLCVIDYARTPAATSWIHTDESEGDDIACVARFDDGRWGVLSRDDATRTFSRESELPFVLALVWASVGR